MADRFVGLWGHCTCAQAAELRIVLACHQCQVNPYGGPQVRLSLAESVRDLRMLVAEVGLFSPAIGLARLIMSPQLLTGTYRTCSYLKEECIGINTAYACRYETPSPEARCPGALRTRR